MLIQIDCTKDILTITNTVLLDNTDFNDITQSAWTVFNLSYKHNCCEEVFVGEYSPTETLPEGFYITSNGIELSPEFFGHSTFKDGIYWIQIVTEVDSIITTEYTCGVIDCGLKCDILTLIGDNSYSKSDLLHYVAALEYGQECFECNCDALCSMYTKIVEEINSQNIVSRILNNTTNGCTNCS